MCELGKEGGEADIPNIKLGMKGQVSMKERGGLEN